MTISDYLSEILHDSIKAVAEKQITISIKITPEYENIKTEPWKSFEYTCPCVDERGTLRKNEDE